MGTLKTAVVGLGLGRHFVRTLAGHPDVDRLVLCDPDSDRAEEMKQSHSEVDAIYQQLDVMLEKEKPDAVCVVTPDHMHLPHSKLCFESGSHVLQTKPLATNLTDARAIVAAAEASGRKLMVAHERRFRPLVKRIKGIIDAGEIGDLIHLRVDAISDKRGQFARAPWYAQTESGRSALNGTGIHEVDLTRHYVGRPIEAVSAFSNRLGDLVFPKDKTTAALFQFEGDTVAQVTVTYEGQQPRSHRLDDHFRAIGTAGTIMGDKLYRVGEEDWEDLSELDDSIQMGIAGAVLAFIDAVANDAPIPVTGEDAFNSLAAADAADQSAARGEVTRPESLK
jgi:predicted dehydrogenase